TVAGHLANLCALHHKRFTRRSPVGHSLRAFAGESQGMAGAEPPIGERVGMRARPQPLRAARETQGRIAVSLHDIEPATFARCALIRDWLADHGVDHVTLLVIPARDLHPLGERSPELHAWLLERRAAGDAIAQHGLR